MSKDDIKINLSPYLGCSKKLVEFFAIIGYEEEAIRRTLSSPFESQDELELTFLSIVISDISYDFASNYIIKQVYPDKPNIIKSGKHPKADRIIFSSCIDTDEGKKKIFFSCLALRFYERVLTRSNEVYFIPKAFLIYSQYPYFSSFNRICDKILYSADEQNEDKDFPVEVFIHCLVTYFPSPINNNLILKDFNPPIFIPKLTGYPYADFNLGKIISSIDLIDFIKIYILIFLELDLFFFSPHLEKLNIFMFALYILNYPLTDSNYFWHIKTMSLKDLEEEGEAEIYTSYKGINSCFSPNIDLDSFRTLNFIIDIDNKKQMINNIKDNKEAKDINLLLKYVNSILKGSLFYNRSFFLEGYLLKLHKNLKNIIDGYNAIARNSEAEDSYFYMNAKILNINRQIQEIFYDFVLNILVELNKDYTLDPSLQSPVVQRLNENPRLSEEEKIFLKFSRETVKYNTYFENFISGFKVYDGLKVSLLFSDEYVNLKKQKNYKEIEDKIKIKYFAIMDKLYISKRKDLGFDLKNLDSEYSQKNYNPSSSKKKEVQLFVLNKDIIRKFIYKKRNKGYYTTLEDPDEIHVDTDNKNSLSFTIQYYFSANNILKPDYYIRGAALYIISICFAFFPEKKIPAILGEYLTETKKIIYFQRYFIFIILKAIKKYYIINKEKGIFPEMGYDNVQKYYEIIQKHLKDNSIIQDEEIFKFFQRNFKCQKENENIHNEEPSEEFSYKFDENNFDNKMNNNLKISGKEIIFIINKEETKFEIISDEAISILFQETYSYYDCVMEENYDIKQFEIIEVCKKAVNLIVFFNRIKENSLQYNLYCLVYSLLSFKKQLSRIQHS